MPNLGRLLTTALLLALSGNSIAQPARQAENVEAIVAAADEKLDHARTYPRAASWIIDDTLAQLESALTKHPNHAPLQMIMGRAYLVRDCGGGSRDCSLRGKAHLVKALELDPKLVRAHVLLALDAFNSECGACAEPHILNARLLAPTDPYVLELLGRQEERLRRYAKATQLYLNAIQAFSAIGKQCPVALTWLSEVYNRVDDYDNAERMLQRAAECAPDGAWAVGNLGTFYIFARGDYEKAIPVLRRALSIANYGYARQGLALALYERWADVCAIKSPAPTCKTLWEEAEAEYPDVRTMFFVSASYSGAGKATRALLETRKVSKELIEQRWTSGRTPLQMAADNDNTDLAVYLLQEGANPNVTDSNGHFPVHVAGSYGNIRVLRALERAKANLKALTRDDNQSVLMFVARAGTSSTDRLAAAQFLIDRGASVHARSATGWHTLSGAINKGDVEMVKFLLKNGADPNDPLPDNLTPAILAITGNRPEILRELIAYRALVPATLYGGSTVEYAEQSGKPEIVKILRHLKQ